MKISRALQKRLINLLIDFLVATGTVIVTSRIKSKKNWRVIKPGLKNTIRSTGG